MAPKLTKAQIKRRIAQLDQEHWELEHADGVGQAERGVRLADLAERSLRLQVMLATMSDQVAIALALRKLALKESEARARNLGRLDVDEFARHEQAIREAEEAAERMRSIPRRELH